MSTTHNWSQQTPQPTLQQNVWSAGKKPHVALLVPRKASLASDIVWEATDELEDMGIEAGLYLAHEAFDIQSADLVLIDPLIELLEPGLVRALKQAFPHKPIYGLPSWQYKDNRQVIVSLVLYGLHPDTPQAA